MTFTFKLSRRLSIGYACSMLAATLLIFGCTGNELTNASSEPGADGPLAGGSYRTDSTTKWRGRGRNKTPSTTVLLAVSPDTVKLLPGAQRTFSASLETTDGTTSTDSIVWTASGGTIDAKGLYTAGSVAGKYRVIARGVNTRAADTAGVEVVTADPAPVRLTVSPDTATLVSGAQRQFSAVLQAADGSAASDSIVWSASGGTVSAKGVYTAGNLAGKYLVIARGVGTRTADTAAVEVDAPTPTSPSLRSVVVTPASVSLVSGSVQQFSASGVADDGSSMAVTASWTATGGSITAGGLYTAGSAGTYRVIATASAKADTAIVTVTASTPTPSSCSGTPLAPTDDWAAKVNAAPSGTIFCVLPGTHLNARNVAPKSKMQFLATSRRAAVLDGQNVAEYAFKASNAPSGVVIRGLVIKNYKPATASQAAIHGDGGFGWLVEDNEVSYNGDTGIRLGRGWVVRGNWVHHNRVIGIGCYKCTGSRVEQDTVEFNPYATITEAGATARAANMKLLRVDSLQIRNNVVRDSPHKGIWLDTEVRNAVVEGNTLLRHGQAAIWQENGYNVVIRNNTVRTCGTRGAGWMDGAGVSVTNSPNVEIYGNVISDCANGVGIMQAAGYPTGAYGRTYVTNLWVHDNQISMTKGRTGIVQNVGNDSVFVYWNNRFDRNVYTLVPSAPFAWRNSNIDETQWKATGNDRSGSFSR